MVETYMKGHTDTVTGRPGLCGSYANLFQLLGRVGNAEK